MFFNVYDIVTAIREGRSIDLLTALGWHEARQDGDVFDTAEDGTLTVQVGRTRFVQTPDGVTTMVTVDAPTHTVESADADGHSESTKVA